MELSSFILVLTLAYANGANDVSKAVATLVGSGVTNYRKAILWGTSWTIAGATTSAFVTHTLVKTFSQGLVQEDTVIQPGFASAVLTGAMVWVLFASRTGLPVSTTHALTGALVGTGLVAVGGEALIWPEIMKKIVLPLLLSPFLALTCSFLIHPAMRLLARRWEGTCLCLMPTARALVAIDAHGGTRTLFQAPTFGQPVVALPSQCDRADLSGPTIQLDTLHWLSSGLASFARGTNDAPKIVAMLLLGATTAGWPSAWSQFVAFGGVALAMGLGSYVGGQRVTEVLAEKVTKMNHTEGLSANLTTSSLVLVAGMLGLPVSTTHLSGSAIIGIGLLKRRNGIHRATVWEMIFAWIVTLPVAALLACLVFLILARFL